MSKFKTVPLGAMYRRMASNEELIGLKCLDVENEEIVYIKDVTGSGVWAGPDADPDNDDGHYYSMRELNYIDDDDADD